MTTPASARPPIAVVVPPPVWAALLIIAGWGLGRLLELAPAVRSPAAAWMLLVAGVLITAWGRITFLRAGTEVVPVSRVNSVLVTHGPFAFTRNPMYLGILLATAGLGFWVGTATALAAAPAFFVFVNLVSIPFEEAKMERQYGDEFRAYMRRVRRWV